MNKLSLLGVIVLTVFSVKGQEARIEAVLDAWHQAASDADFGTYFGLMTEDAVFVGTDATENWQLPEFKAYARPHFDKGRAWSFTPVERHIYLDEAENFAWFDELLDTQMKLCRGSGVLKKVGGDWKVAHYVLSLAVPNDKVGELIRLKRESDSLLVAKLKKD